ncbi:MAG: SDR family NAD(P)-dependent oxidoreductase [Betaproteobacteria bacterium]|nr:MAG: SDR family NAD(P)-dependent oxidoreductase [Betaproteobacteria bacterium]
MPKVLKDQVALITGASRGIGRAIATTLAKQGVSVALVSRNVAALEETAQACRESGYPVLMLPCDLENTESIPSMVSQTAAKLGGLNILINNAGVNAPGAADSGDLQDWDLAIDINLRGLLHLTRHALPEIEKASWGAVINIASMAGRRPFGGSGAYCATKHGVVGFTHALFDDVREKNIKVSVVCPGFVATDMTSGMGLSVEKMIQPDDVAKAVDFVLNYPDTGCPIEIQIMPQRSPYLASS